VITNTQGLVKVTGKTDQYAQQSIGIKANEYAKNIYFRFYVELPDGTYAYSDIFTETVTGYCADVFDRGNAKTKTLCASLLYYGAAAQTYFDKMTTGLVDENVPDDYAYLKTWDSNLLDELAPIPETTFVVSQKVAHFGNSLSLVEAITINAYFNIDASIDVQKAELLIWNKDAEKLTADNYAYSKEMQKVTVGSYAGKYAAQSDLFYSNRMGDTIFVVAKITDTDGNVYYSAPDADSPEYYASRAIDKSTNPSMVELAKRMVIYGNCAKSQFG